MTLPVGPAEKVRKRSVHLLIETQLLTESEHTAVGANRPRSTVLGLLDGRASDGWCEYVGLVHMRDRAGRGRELGGSGVCTGVELHGRGCTCA